MSQPDREMLLHEDPMVRDSLGFYFFESWAKDPELAPLVLQACRLYGEEASLNLLSFACRFPLGSRGLLEALRALGTSHPPFVDIWISTARLDLLMGRSELLRSLLSFRAVHRLERRRFFQSCSLAELWRRLAALCRKLDHREVEPGDWDELEDLLEALAGAERVEQVVDRLERLRENESLHLKVALVELAGAMHLSEQCALLVGLLGEGEEAIGRAAVQSLARMGSATAVDCIGASYAGGSRRFRRFALATLKALKLDPSEALLRSLLEVEADPALRGRIFDALRFHYTGEARELLSEELLHPSSWMIPEEIRKALWVSDRIRGVRDPEVEAWRAEIESSGDLEVCFHIPFVELHAPRKT